MTRKFYTLILLMALAFTANAQSRYAEHSKLSTGKWVKIRVADEGVYQLTSTTLKGMGFSQPSKVRLYGYNLPVLPEANIENIDDDLTEIPLYRKANGTLLFYSCGTTQWSRKTSKGIYTHKNNPYSDYIYYFLTEGNDSPAPFSQENAQSTYSTVQTTYYAHSLYEQDGFSFLNSGRTFFEAYDYATGATKNYQINLENACCGDLNLNVQFGAAGGTASTLSVSVGDNNVGSISLSALSSNNVATISNRSFTLYDQVATSLNVTLKHTRGAGISGHLDYLRASYEAQLSISGKNYLVFSPNENGSRVFELQGAQSGISIWNITQPTAPCELTGTLNGDTYRFSATNARFTHKYLAVNTSATFPTPQTVGTIKNQDLHALENIDLLIIVPANGNLTQQAERLAAAHTEKDGLKCAVVRADQVYNEFSAGTPDATAYRRLMKMLYDKRFTSSPIASTEKGSLNLLLFGPCMWDNRFVTQGLKATSPDKYLLTYESDNSWSHTESFVLEEYYTLLADGKGVSPLKEKPDCGVGRIPVSNATEAKNVVDKLIAHIYNSQAGAWKNTICMMGDDGDKNIHMEDAENVLQNTMSLFPNYRYKRIYWDTYERVQSATGSTYPAVLAEINKTMQEGALIMDYTGHGAPYMLSHEQVLRTSHFQGWSSPRLPLWITAACDVAPFDMNTENIGCEALLNKQGCAMGFIGTARTVYSSNNRTLNRNFMSHVLATKQNGEPYTIGEALAKAKADIIDAAIERGYYQPHDSINKVHFVLLGDPAIRLITPTYSVQIDKINNQDIDPAQPTTISAGEIVTVEGHIVDTEGNIASDFNGLVSPTIYDNEEHIVSRNNAGDIEADPFEYDDHTRSIYAGTDSIKSGKFTFTFPVPIDINYSDEKGLMLLYAINHTKTIEAQNKFEDFLIGGTAEDEQTDDVAPTIAAYSDGYNMANTSYTNEQPTLRIELYDESGINTTGNGLGHDIIAIIDGNEATTYTLNSYYSQAVGDYRHGTINYTLPAPLAAGKHTLVIRAFDTYNNMGQQAYTFTVVKGLTEEYDIFDLSGRKIGNTNDRSSLPTGVYIKRKRLTSPSGTVSTSTEKILVTQ